MILQLLVVNLFLSTGFSKLFHLHDFRAAVVSMSGIQNRFLNTSSAYIIVASEIVCSVCLLLNWHIKIASTVLILMVVIFTVVISGQMKNAHATCHCGGILGDEKLSRAVIIRNILLICIMLVPFLPPSRIQLHNLWSTNPWLGTNIVFSECLILIIFYVIRFAQQMNRHLSGPLSSQQGVY